jgi:hypothetical protein
METKIMPYILDDSYVLNSLIFLLNILNNGFPVKKVHTQCFGLCVSTNHLYDQMIFNLLTIDIYIFNIFLYHQNNFSMIK